MARFRRVKTPAKAKRRHVMTPARQAALKKAQAASAASRHLRAMNKNHGKAPSKKARGIGTAGLKKNTIPYIRVNKRSQTVGVNAGTIISPNKRIAVGAYARLENINKKGPLDQSLKHAGLAIAPKGSRRRKVNNYLKKNVTVSNPAVRAAIGGAEVRLGTSRGAGPTVILRRGRHKVSRQGSYKAIKRYDTHARKLHAKKQGKPRPQRRKANHS